MRNTNRKLASVVVVDKIYNIPDADNIEMVTMENKAWKCVVKKGSFKPGDVGVYFEIDSFIPVVNSHPRYDFLKSYIRDCNNILGYHIRTNVFRKQVSQGLILPISQFQEIQNPVPGQDVTNELGVMLFEDTIPGEMMEYVISCFPSYIPSTSLERIQNHPEYFELYRSHKFEVSYKMDGQTITIFNDDGKLKVCTAGYVVKNCDKFPVFEVLKKLHWDDNTIPMGVAVQCELVGPGINKNRHRLKEHRLYIYNVFNLQTYKYVTNDVVWKSNSKLSDLVSSLYVPVIYRSVDLFRLYTDTESLLKLADTTYPNEPLVCEGIVCKSLTDPSVRFKVVNNKYLVKYSL